jgi:DNA-binding GntR family transcriptional regulator
MAEPVIQRTNFVDEAYAAIKELIIGGELLPGTQLKLEALSQRLGVSNSPIREALRRLENERWVQAIPFRGAFVRPFDAVEVVELYEIRRIIESAALRKAMPNVPGVAVEALSKALMQIQTALRAGDQAGYLSADVTFHRVLVAMAGNVRLSEMFLTLVEQGRCFMLGRTREAMEKYQEGEDEHAALYKAVAGGDSERALALLHQHLSVSLEEVREEATKRRSDGATKGKKRKRTQKPKTRIRGENG